MGKFLKDHDRFANMCVVVGALFNFRRLTLSALKTVVGTRAPYIQVSWRAKQLNCIVVPAQVDGGAA